jgi:hypothetical protein
MRLTPSSDGGGTRVGVRWLFEGIMTMRLAAERKPGTTPSEDDPKIPRPPGNNNPEPDVPDESDDLGDLLRPVTA